MDIAVVLLHGILTRRPTYTSPTHHTHTHSIVIAESDSVSLTRANLSSIYFFFITVFYLQIRRKKSVRHLIHFVLHAKRVRPCLLCVCVCALGCYIHRIDTFGIYGQSVAYECDANFILFGRPCPLSHPLYMLLFIYDANVLCIINQVKLL